jgi:hypothetical protein
MATWTDLASYVRSNYKIGMEEPGKIGLTFETDNLRSQMVFLWHMVLANGAEDWVQIESPIAQLLEIDLARALQEVGRTVCGGLATHEDLLTFRHAVPLLNLNINEFERPLLLVTTTADHLEGVLTGRDKF